MAARRQVGHGRLHEEEGAEEVGGEGALEGRRVEPLEGAVEDGAGVVHHDVEPPEVLDGGGHEAPHLVGVLHARRDGQSPAAEGLHLVDDGLAGVELAAGDHDRRAGLDEAEGHRSPEAAGAAGHDGDTAGQVEEALEVGVHGEAVQRTGSP